MSTLVITAATVKELTGLSKNIEDRKLARWIDAVQLELKGDLGTTGYATLIGYIEADDTLATQTAYQTLRNDYIRPWMAWRVLERATVALFAEPERNGTYTRSGDDYATVSAQVLGMRKADARDMAHTYKEALHEYLKDNTATFTWYASEGECGTDGTSKSYAGGVITRVPAYSSPYGEGRRIWPDDYTGGIESVG